MVFIITASYEKKIDDYIEILDKNGYIVTFTEDEPHNYSYYTIEINSLSDLLSIQDLVGYSLIINGTIIEIYNGYRE
jgi:hypothetical protein